MLWTDEERASETPERALEISRDLQDRALALLEWPVARTTVRQLDGVTIVVEPANWKPSDVVDMFLISQELQARALAERLIQSQESEAAAAEHSAVTRKPKTRRSPRKGQGR